jgi:hypothetical protein
MNRKKTKWYLVFIILFGVVGYLREFFFVYLNIVMFELYYGSHSEVKVPEIMGYFRNLPYDTLYYSKYIFTLIWTIIFFILNYWCLKKLSKVPVLKNILVITYLLMLFIAGLSMMYGYFVKDRLQNDEYTLSRWLLGIAQSPLITLVFLASEKLYYGSGAGNRTNDQ